MTEGDDSSKIQHELDEALLALEELSLEDPEDALSMFESLPEPVQALPESQLMLARIHQTTGQLTAARDLVLGVIDEPTIAADAHHLLGDVLEDLGQTRQANEHFQRTLELDTESFHSTHDGDPAALEGRVLAILQQTVSDLPEEVAPRVRSARLEVKLLPTHQEVEDGLDPRALSCWREHDGVSVFVLYAANLDAEFGDLDEFGEFRPHVRDCIHREIIDHLELSAPESRRLGLLADEDVGASLN